RAIELDAPELGQAWSVGGAPGGPPLGRVPLAELPRPDTAAPMHSVRPQDPCAVLFTSGTTGAPKGVICPHAQFWWWGVLTGGEPRLGPEDRLYTVLPLFHTNAINTFWQALIAGSSYAFGSRFSASRFWEEIADTDATVTYLLGTMVHILLQREAHPQER